MGIANWYILLEPTTASKSCILLKSDADSKLAKGELELILSERISKHSIFRDPQILFAKAVYRCGKDNNADFVSYERYRHYHYFLVEYITADVSFYRRIGEGIFGARTLE